jgi:N-acetylglucosaminyldiphosphoundecaprenol N-acetyl-beta-D-mannosaminyltransferase
MMQVPFCMGVGGSFDIISGRTKRAPAWMQKSGLEWCYRIYQEPGRMWKRYAKTNPVFVWMVVKEYVKRRAPQLNRLCIQPQYDSSYLRGRRGKHRAKS